MLKLAIVGTGGMAEYQAKKFSEISGCVIVACADRNLVHAQEFARHRGIPHSFNSIDALIAFGEFDAVTCCVVDSQHARICSAALAAGYPVLCEKPLGRNAAESGELARLAKSAAVPALVNFSKRNMPALRALKSIIESGRLGSISGVSASYLQDWVITGRWGDWNTAPRWRWRLTASESTRGVLGDLGSHLVDSLSFLFNDYAGVGPCSGITLPEAVASGALKVKALDADFLETPLPFVDCNASMLVDGAIPVSMRVSWIEPNAEDVFRIAITGSNGIAELDSAFSRRKIRFGSPDGTRTETIEGNSAPTTYETFVGLASGYSEEKTFLYEDSAPTFEQGLVVQRILDSFLAGDSRS